MKASISNQLPEVSVFILLRFELLYQWLYQYLFNPFIP